MTSMSLLGMALIEFLDEEIDDIDKNLRRISNLRGMHGLQRAARALLSRGRCESS